MTKPVLEVYNNTHLLIKTKLATVIANAVQGCYLTDVAGDGTRLCVPWDLPTVQAVAQWRIPTLSPILRDYDFIGCFKPYLHQLKICSFLTAHKRAYCLADMGTGKTASAIWSMDYLFKMGLINRALVIGVLSNMKSTWEDEIFSVNPLYQVSVLHGEKGERLNLARNKAQIHIINHDGVEIIQEQLLKNKYDLVIIDELTAYKNSNSARFKKTFPICQNATYVWGLTGTPMPNKPDETYGQIKLITPDNVQGMSYTRYKERVMRKLTNFIWQPRFDAIETVKSFMQPAIKIEKSEVLTLPTVTHEYVYIPLTEMQSSFYKTMAKRSYVEGDSFAVSAVNGGALMTKLLQVATGAIYSDEGQALKFDVQPRIDKVIELIKSTRARSTDPLKGKTIVFAPFKHTIKLLEDELSKHFNIAIITGDTSAKARAKIFNDFQTKSEPDVLLAVAKAMSHGVTATSASSIIWFGPVTSNETYQQACNRIDRPGQTQEMTIYHLYSSKVEEKLYRTLQQRKLSQADLLNLYTDFIKGI